MTVEERIVRAFSEYEWRIDNLYMVRDMVGKVVPFVRNSSQRKFNSVKHPRKITTKVRQLGLSTYAVIDALDDCIFNAGTQAGIQSFGLIESAKLRGKAQLAWERLDPKVKALTGVEVISDNANGMEFSNGSVLRIGNFRGDTLTRFHVSELAKIAKDAPLKAMEIKTGAFEAVAMGNTITIESTADGNVGMHADIWFESKLKLDQGEELNPLDFYPIFLGYMDVDKYNLDFYTKANTRVLKWFDTLRDDYRCKVEVVCCGNILDTEVCPTCSLVAPYIPTEQPAEDRVIETLTFTIPKLNWTIAKLRSLGDEFNSEYPVIADIAFHTPIEGAYWSYEYTDIIKDGRIKTELYNPALPVHVSWDLGMKDEMVLIFCQVGADKIPRLINEYHHVDRGIPFFVGVLNQLSEEKGYRYGTMYVPFDIEVKEMSTEKTRKTILQSLGVTNITNVDKLSFQDSIQIARLMLAVCEIDKEYCPMMLATLQKYRKKYDKALGMYLVNDVHDIYSNYGASFRYMAQGLGYKIKDAYKEAEKLQNHSSGATDYVPSVAGM